MNTTATAEAAAIRDVLRGAKELAQRYYKLTGRPLGVTGEIAEYEAIRLLDLEPAVVRQAGWDATKTNADGHVERIQIKGRWMVGGYKPHARLGRIDIATDWDSVLMVLLDASMTANQIFKANRSIVVDALGRPGSTARNDRGQLSIGKFKSIAEKVWPR